jgi:periplasmic copper chaperone A
MQRPFGVRLRFGDGRTRLVPLLGAALLMLAACASSSGQVTVSDAWVRATAGPDQPTAAYLTITNESGQGDTLIAASSPTARTVAVHKTTLDPSGMSGMASMSRLDVPAGSTIRLQPGIAHLMVMGLSRPLAVGQTLEVDLVFEHAGTIVVQADVRSS